MTYDPATVLSRYRQMLDTPEGEPTEYGCAITSEHGTPHDTLGCDGRCQNCCVGMVEVVRQFAEQQATLETRSIEFDDILTKAGRIEARSTEFDNTSSKARNLARE